MSGFVPLRPVPAPGTLPSSSAWYPAVTGASHQWGTYIHSGELCLFHLLVHPPKSLPGSASAAVA
eukprot:907721-Prorocentrum_minimum.AAC.1